MKLNISESVVEEAAISWLESLGYTRIPDNIASPDGDNPERPAHSDSILEDRLCKAVDRLNPNIPAEARQDAINKVITSEYPNLIEENRRLHQMMIEGVNVEFSDNDGNIRGDLVQLINFDDPTANDWLVLDQFTVIENQHNRRPDLVVFINGLPIAVIELKNPVDEDATLENAFNQLQTYKHEIPSLFRTNGLLVTSDGLGARVGSLTANLEWFMPWKTIDGEQIIAKGSLELETLIKGVFDKTRLLSLLKHFIVFEKGNSGYIKKIAGYHQFHATHKAVARTVTATSESGDKKAGVIWHTQGSGKSLLMAFYAGLIIQHPELSNPTLVVLTDRNDLDDQLFTTFAGCKDLLRQTPKQADSRENLKELLSVASGGVIFTTIQKFGLDEDEQEYPELSDRRNIVVIADEAHRSQYGFEAEMNTETGDSSLGLAAYMRDALPNASFIGFTGTPIEYADANTPAVFGKYIDIYDIQRAVDDGATVPIYYESRLAHLGIDATEIVAMNTEIESLLQDHNASEKEKRKKSWSRIEGLVGAEKRIDVVSKDMVEHFEKRLDAREGKGMIVCMTRKICVAMYDAIIAKRPHWHDDDINKGKIKVIMSGSATDPVEWQSHIGGKTRKTTIEKRIKDYDDELKVVIVCDMWLTGFDVPPLHTMYIDKPIKGHNLMQAIARVNRVFRDKPGGTVVDYIGIAQNLKDALSIYSDTDRQHVGINHEDAIVVLQEKYEIVRDMYHGFDYLPAVDNSTAPADRLKVLVGAVDWVLAMLDKGIRAVEKESDKSKAKRRYKDAVYQLSQAFSLVPTSDEAKEIREEIGFFKAVQSSIEKEIKIPKDGKSKTGMEETVQVIIGQAVQSADIVNLLELSELRNHDLSILDERFLEELREMETRNLALEVLNKLIKGEIKSKLRSRIVVARSFSERLADTINRYHSNVLTTAQVIDELIKLALEIKIQIAEQGKDGFSSEEIAFYEALCANDSAIEVMGDDKLKAISIEVYQSVKTNSTIDWHRSEMARARMRVAVKRILKKHGYPPDLESEAIQTVLQQAEVIASQEAA